MNHLAHVLLSCGDDYRLAGNFMADFINNKEAETLSDTVNVGIELHKQIDSYTDSHTEVLAAVRLLRPTQGKYAPVTVDILFDYFLSNNWARYSSIPMRTFTQDTYKRLQSMTGIFPLALQERFPRMMAHDFLHSCEDIERLIDTFVRVGKRAKFDHHFDRAHIDLVENEEALQGHFDRFFPDLMAHVAQFCDCN
jgi:acyl carrier protein phosphodiesterase